MDPGLKKPCRVSDLASGGHPACYGMLRRAVMLARGSHETYRFLDFELDVCACLGALPFAVTGRGYLPPRVLAASPDGRSVVVSHMDQWDRDIIVADNFR